jgi:hypothetical protein
MDEITITDAQYTTESNATIRCTIDGVRMQVPCDPANRHYNEIMRQVASGTLTIEDAD